jgi:hypothetical protein
MKPQVALKPVSCSIRINQFRCLPSLARTLGTCVESFPRVPTLFRRAFAPCRRFSRSLISSWMDRDCLESESTLIWISCCVVKDATLIGLMSLNKPQNRRATAERSFGGAKGLSRGFPLSPFSKQPSAKLCRPTSAARSLCNITCKAQLSCGSNNLHGTVIAPSKLLVSPSSLVVGG